MNDFLLVGAGGHGRVVADLAAQCGLRLAAYSDRRDCPWTGVDRVTDAEWAAAHSGGWFVMGLGGVAPDGLVERLKLYRHVAAIGLSAPCLVHASAVVAATARLGAGTVVMAGAIVQMGAEIGEAAIVNSRALVEHDARVGAGTHVAPGAMVLGDCIVGETVMIGAGAVVLPGSEVPARAGVRAMTRWPQ